MSFLLLSLFFVFLSLSSSFSFCLCAFFCPFYSVISTFQFFSVFSTLFPSFSFFFVLLNLFILSNHFNYLVLILNLNFRNFFLLLFFFYKSLLFNFSFLFSSISVNLIAFLHSTTCSGMSSDPSHNANLVSVLSLLYLRFTYHICSLISVASFNVSLSHSSNYFFLFYLFSAIVQTSHLPFSTLFFLLLNFLFFLSSTFSIWICSCSPHFSFSFLFLVLYFLRS